MISRQNPASGLSSPLETVTVTAALFGFGGVGLLWGAGILIGSILGSALPGDFSDGIAAMLAEFPRVGAAWQPPISSGLIWFTTLLIAALFVPLAWKVFRYSRASSDGARWATLRDLQRAGLLVSDRIPTHAVAEATPDES